MIDFTTLDQEIKDALRFQEATTPVERELAIEDKGWINLSSISYDITSQKRTDLVQLSRLYHVFDPLAIQAIRIWTDYTFGTGLSWSVEEKNKQTKKVLDEFWNSKDNATVFGSRGQRRCSEKHLVDGEVFFAIFLGKESRIRTIDPLEITEIITDTEDIDKPLFYKREWSDRKGTSHTDYLRSYHNIKNERGKSYSGGSVSAEKNSAIVYHLARGTGQRGVGLLFGALDSMKYAKKFVAARVAMMLARTRFAEKITVQGGQAAVDSVKASYEDKTPHAASTRIENEAAKSEPIQPPQDARNAYDDYRMLKLQICAAVGIPEQYFGDIATGNLATAKTVELPMLKMFQSNQSVWSDTFQDIFEIVLDYNKVPQEKWYTDRDFPAIAPEDAFAAAQAIMQVVTAFPEFSSSTDVQQAALMAIGINDPDQVIEQLKQEAKVNPAIPLAKALREFKKFVEVK